MNLLKKLSVALAFAMLLFVAVGIFLPAKRHLERTVLINAPASTVFDEVDSLKQWKNWSPWRGIDPHVAIQYKGPDAGVGCSMSWRSVSPVIGNGTQTIVVSEPHQHLVIEFVDWKGMSASWNFEEQEGGGTKVTWSNDNNVGDNLFAKYQGMMMAAKLGKSYQKGLQNLKEYAEECYAEQVEDQDNNLNEASE